MTEPLKFDFAVECPIDRAFELWTAEIAKWWPSDHTVSGEPGVVVELQGYVGGRIFEQTSDGDEHDWGVITQWDPPTLLAYSWHLRANRSDTTDVTVRFSAKGASTVVEIEHSGWERLGANEPERRNANLAGWTSLIPHYTGIVESTGRKGL